MKKITRKFWVISTFLLIGQFALGQTAKDSLEARKVSDGSALYLFNGDMTSFGNLFSKNATFINVGGLVAKGKDEIIDLHKKWSVDTSTHAKYKTASITFISKDIVIAYMVWSGLKFKDGKASKFIQSGYLTNVIQRQKGVWKIVSATNAYTGEKDLMPYNQYKW